MITEQMTPAQLEAALSQFCGSETFTRHGLMRAFLMTEGVVFLAEQAGAHWLMDAIISHQLNSEVCREAFQVWKLVRNSEGHGAVLTMTDGDSDEPIVTQVIELTDFPLPEIKLWLEGPVLMLPNER